MVDAKLLKMPLMLAVLLVTVSSCVNDPFPLEYVYRVDQMHQECDKCTIDQRRYTVDDCITIPWEFCPAVAGIVIEDVARLTDWARRQARACQEK